MTQRGGAAWASARKGGCTDMIEAGLADAAVLTVHEVSKSFGGVHAVREVGFDVAAGEVVALVGENGAGKSTLKNLITGQFQPDSGSIEVGGHSPRDPIHTRNLGVLAVHQEFSLFPSLTVVDNVFLFGRRRTGPALRTRAKAEAECARLLDEIGADFHPADLVSRLSPAQQQLVEVVKALAQDPALLILDEPTASLNLAEREHIHLIVRRLQAQGVCVLYITHHLEEVFELCSRTIVMRDGQLVSDRPTADLTRSGLEELMVGREVQAVERPRPPTSAHVKLRVADVDGPGIAEPVSFELKAGEVFGLAGLVGSGRTEVAQAIFGVVPAGGTVEVSGEQLKRRTPALMKRHGVAFVTEDRRHEGLFLDRSIRENLSAPTLRSLSRSFLQLVSRRREQRQGDALIAELKVRGAALERPSRSLSGGNQQKLVIGKWLATNPEVIILDEPTRGIDVGAKAEVHSIIGRLAESGKAVLVISSDMSEVLGIAHRVGIMHKGRLVTILQAEAADPVTVIKLATGGN